MTVTTQGTCAITYFEQPTAGEINLSDGGDSAAIGNHLLPVTFLNENDFLYTGQCIKALPNGEDGIGTDLNSPHKCVVNEFFNTALTHEVCFEHCKNFKHAGLHLKSCCCAESLPENNFLPDADCHHKCAGDTLSTDSCGGSGDGNGGRWSFFSIETPQEFTGQCISYDTSLAIGGIVVDAGTVIADLTIEKCLEECANFKYAAVQNGNTCHCDNEFNLRIQWLPDTDCSVPCDGDPAQICGGSRKLNIYTVPSQFSTWTDWSDCSSTCGGGEMTRSRTCQAGCFSFTEDLLQTQVCNEVTCPG